MHVEIPEQVGPEAHPPHDQAGQEGLLQGQRGEQGGIFRQGGQICRRQVAAARARCPGPHRLQAKALRGAAGAEISRGHAPRAFEGKWWRQRLISRARLQGPIIALGVIS